MMLHLFADKSPWFRARKYGYGAGLPIRWEGWMLLTTYLAFALGMAAWVDDSAGLPPLWWWLLFGAATAVFVLIARARTEGGWKWRGSRGA